MRPRSRLRPSPSPATPDVGHLTLTHHRPAYPAASLWQVEEVRASLDGQPAGLLRISFVPASRFEPLAADIYQYLLSRNKLGTYAAGYEVRLDRISHAALADLAYRAKEAVDGWSAASAVRWQELTPAQLRRELEGLRPAITARFGPERDAFARFHVDKPLVDYVEVVPALRRRGIARALYEEAARWCARRGLDLYASGTQTDDAAAVWRSMAMDGRVAVVADPSAPAARRRRLRPA